MTIATLLLILAACLFPLMHELPVPLCVDGHPSGEYDTCVVLEDGNAYLFNGVTRERI